MDVSIKLSIIKLYTNALSESVRHKASGVDHLNGSFPARGQEVPLGIRETI